jgi:hypothetical protein
VALIEAGAPAIVDAGQAGRRRWGNIQRRATAVRRARIAARAGAVWYDRA